MNGNLYRIEINKLFANNYAYCELYSSAYSVKRACLILYLIKDMYIYIKYNIKNKILNSIYYTKHYIYLSIYRYL